MEEIEKRRGRPPMRPEFDTVEEDPRERARRRAAEVREHLGGGFDEGLDEFRAPPPPDGWHYEWKRHMILGWEDSTYQVELRRLGWEPVPVKRHPEMMPDNTKSNYIERKGMILMERPLELVEEARAIERRRAALQVRAKEEQLSGTPEGGLGHRQHSSVKPKISKSFEAMPIPEK